MARWWEDKQTLDDIWGKLRNAIQEQGGGSGDYYVEPGVPAMAAPRAQTLPTPTPQWNAAPAQAQPAQWGGRTPSPQPAQWIPSQAGRIAAGYLPSVTRPMEPAPQPAGGFPVWRDWTADWARIKAESFPDEEPRLPGVLAERRAQQAQLAEQRQAGVYPGLQPTTGTGIIPAAWHDIKQVPVIGALAGGTEAIGRGVIRALDVPAQAVEQLLGRGMVNTPQSAPRSIAEVMGASPAMLGGFALPGAPGAAEPVTTAQSLQQALEAEGIAPEAARAALMEASRITYSGTEAMLTAARRILAGEDGRVVAEGKTVNTQEPTAEDRAAYNQYIAGVAARGGDVQAAEADVLRTGRIPGEARIVPELVGQVVLDPLNMVDWIGKGQQVGAAAERARKALGVTDEAGQVARAVEAVAPLADEVGDVARGALAAAPEVGDVARAVEAGAEVVQGAPEVARIAAETAQQAPEVARQADAVQAAVMASAPESQRGWLGRVWDRINPFALTPESAARQAVNDAVEMTGTVIADARSPDEAVAMLRQFVDDPQKLEGVLGSVPEWASSGRARETLAQIGSKLDDLPSVKAARAGEAWNPARFILDVDGLLDEAAAIPTSSKGLYGNLAESYKGLMSEFYLRTPGYAIRNATGDLSTMAADGLLSFDRWDNVQDLYKRMGPTTSRVELALRGGSQGAAQVAEIGKQSRLGKLVGGIFGEKAGQTVGGISEGIGRTMASGTIAGRRTILGEETRYARAHYAALQRALGQVWRPTIPDEIVQLLGPQRTAALGEALRRAVNQDEMVQAVARATSNTAGGLFDYGRILGSRTDELSVDVLRSLDNGLAGATSADEAARVFDEVLAQLDTDLGRVVAGDPFVPARRMNTTAATLQDAAEDAAQLEKLAKQAGASGEQAAAIAQDYARAAAQMEAETAALEARVMETAGQLLESGQADGKQLAAVLQDVRARTWDIQAETRTQVDTLRRELYKQINAVRDIPNLDAKMAAARIEALWGQYYGDVRQLRGDEQGQVRQMLRALQESLARGQVPEIAEDVRRARVQALRGRQETVRGRQERLAGLNLVENLATDDREFAQRLETMRLAVDGSQLEGWRTAMINPSRDALDVMAQAERDVQRYGSAAAAKHEEVYQLWRSTWGKKNAMTKAEFRDLVDPIWAEAFRQQTGRFDLARRELMQLPMGEGAMARMMQELGWPAEAAQGLSRETAALVLRERIAWDAALGEPALPLSQLEEWTLEGLARALGIDVSDPRMVDSLDWRRIAERADREARVYESMASDANAFFNVAPYEGMGSGLGVVDALRQARAGDPAFNQRMEQGARLLREMADGAWARTSLTNIASVGTVVPEGAEIVKRVQRGNMWVVQLQGQGQVLDEVLFDNPADALREVSRLEMELGRGAGVPAGWVPRDLMDAAARFGIDEGNPDEWKRLADLAETRGTDWLMVGDEYGRQSQAAQAALRLPEGTTRTIYQTEVTARSGRMSARQEQALVGALGKEATTAADTYVGQLLEMMGVSQAELGQLDLAQRRRLLEEVAAGGVLETASGGARQIDGLTPERRARIIDAAAGDSNLVRLAQGAAADPRTALGYEWMSVAEQARARSEALALVQAGILDAEDIPAALADADARRALMEAMGEMQAEARGVQDSVARIFEETDEALEEATRRLIAGGMAPEQAMGMAAVAQGDEAARAALLKRAMAEGGMTVEEVIRAGQAAGQAVEPPTMAEMADVVVEQQRRLLEQLRVGMLDEWDGMAAQAGERVPVWARNKARRWVQGDLQKQWSEARAVAVRMATQMADDALLDYSKRRRFDTWLALVTPYSYWRTRSARNWAIRLAQQPGTLARYMRYNKAMEKYNEERGYRERFAGSVEIPTGGALPGWMGGGVFVNPSSLFFPFEGLEASDWEDPAEAQNGVEWLYKTMSRYGFKPHGFLDIGLQATGLVSEEAAPGERVNPLAGIVAGTPQARMIQGARALLQGQGAGPVPGLLGGGPQMQPWESYRVARMLSNLAADDPRITADVLLAQEMMRRVATGELSANEAIGRESSANLARIAREAGWTDDDVRTGQVLLNEAWRRTQQEQAIPTLTSGMLGQSARIYPSGERAQVDLQGQLYGAGYSPLTGTGSRAEYEALRAERPESYARGTARQFVPGEVDPYADWTPQAARGTILYRPEKEAALQQLGATQLDALRADGLWNRDALQTARDAYTTQMTDTRARLGMGEYSDSGVFSAKYGSTPQEAQAQARATVLQAISNARPKRGDFTTADEYTQAVESFYSAIQAGNLTDAGVVLPQNLPQSVVSYAQTVKPADVEALWRENDTLAEALTTAFDAWYGSQWDAYRLAAGPQVVPGLTDAAKSARYDRRAKAWDQFVENGPAVKEAELIRQVRALYGGRFSDAEIKAALQGMQPSTLLEAWEGRMTPEALAERREGQAMDTARDRFWEAYRSLPKGAKWAETKGQPIVAVLLDADTRGTGTREQYEMAGAVLRSWLAANGYAVDGRQQTVDGGSGTGGTTSRSYSSGGGYTSTRRAYTSSGGGYTSTKRSSGGGGGGQAAGGLPSALGDWATARQVISAPLRRQLESYFLRGVALDDGAQRELTALAQALGWGGTLESLLALLAGVFKARSAVAGTPSGKFRDRSRYLGRVTS